MSAHDRREWVRLLLSSWGAWVSQRAGGGLGYPKVNMLAREGGSSASVDYIPVGVQQAEAVDAGMARLRQQDARGWAVLMLRYVGSPQVRASRRRPLLMSEMARTLAVHHDTVERWIVGAEDDLAVLLAHDRRAS